MELKKHPIYDIFVTPCGRIFSNGKERSLNSNQRYKRFTICIEPGKPKTLSVHRVVVETYINSIPQDMVVNHIDGNKHNNHFTNLEVVTHKQNTKHAIENSLTKPKVGEDSHFSKLKEGDILEIYKLIKLYKGNEEIANELGISFKQVSQIRSGRKWNYLFKKHFTHPIEGIHMQVPIPIALEVVSEIEKGILNLKEISEKFELDRSTVSRVSRKEVWIKFWKNIEDIKRVYNIK